RAAHRPAAVPGGHPNGDLAPGDAGAAGPAVAPAAGRSRRPGRDLPDVSGERPGPPVPERGGPGGRPPPLPGRGADAGRHAAPGRVLVGPGAAAAQILALRSPPCGGLWMRAPKLDGFEFRECLGQGAFGQVWLAWDVKLDTMRAVKVVAKDRF